MFENIYSILVQPYTLDMASIECHCWPDQNFYLTCDMSISLAYVEDINKNLGDNLKRKFYSLIKKLKAS